MSTGVTSSSLFNDSEDVEAPREGRVVLRELVESFEKNLIVTVLFAAGGSHKRAAEALGVLPTTFQEKLKRFGLLNHRIERRGRGGESARAQRDSRKPRSEAQKTPQESFQK